MFISRPNVCTQRQEDIEDLNATNDNGDEQKSNSQTFHFGVHLTLNSCVERSHKHVCKSMYVSLAFFLRRTQLEIKLFSLII